MHPCHKAVLDAAANLETVIGEAEAIGLRVDFPKHLLAGIPVSETKKFAPPAPEPKAKPSKK
ncbi:hypothetical protein [Mesorhizobium sp. B263B2A]|uniref:hypothetical protein n=1 Tax=Mesorhizobium sp. B263B2A TaxID=2876669 RepID=UPI001CD13CE6|nr:hypothetical protein [Mesorhizobium sp. B263B2A]MCA0032765.1 hypothetical protein [Mesorhizobium sp. B263B2A]